ncbi:glycosyltransferase family 4 protein [bacterium]|nr:glycosyltransferase family 4 protein [Verrucomicrobiales bacterium]MDC0312121.1 glycosyltransferase family 4 protein [bacterium]
MKSGPLFPLDTGGKRRSHAILNELARSNQVTYLALLPQDQEISSDEREASYAQEKVWIASSEPKKNSLRFYLEVLKNLFFSITPVVLDRYRNFEMSQKISEFDASGRFDLIVCDFLTPATNFEFHEIKTPTVLFQHNVEAQIWKRMAQEKGNLLSRCYFQSQYKRLWEAEKHLCSKFNGVITVSPEDASRCREDYDLDNVLGAVPTGVDTSFFSPPLNRSPQKGLIGFLGSMDWMPNIDCVRYFAHDIFPLIRERYEDARFRIIGRNPTQAVKRLADNDGQIEITGTVEDVRPHLDDCEILVVPLRSGGGTRIKIFEAMAQGVPVVSTAIGAEGLPVINGETIIIADTPGSFADAALEILVSPDKGAAIALNSRQKLVAEHSWATVTSSFMALCYKVIPAKD